MDDVFLEPLLYNNYNSLFPGSFAYLISLSPFLLSILPSANIIEHLLCEYSCELKQTVSLLSLSLQCNETSINETIT